MKFTLTRPQILSRARGALLGQLCGDALGSQVEFKSPAQILEKYPQGVRLMKDGGVWQTKAGQITDDSELALLLARLLVDKGSYDQNAALAAYKYWLSSNPFDCGNTIRASLSGNYMPDSQANGAMMRISPLGIFCSRLPMYLTLKWAAMDAALTHPNRVTKEVNKLYAFAIANAISGERTPSELHSYLYKLSEENRMDHSILERIELSVKSPPADFTKQSGWVLLAFQNALYQLLHAQSLEEAIVETVSRGGDTDTNGAICGALLGALFGEEALPSQWTEAVLNCRPQEGKQGVLHPRPEVFWPSDARELADKLAGLVPLRPSESGQVSENILFRRGTSDDITRVIEIWEVAVRSSHHFLSENDIIDIRQTVSQTISSVVGLFVAEGDFGELLGFTILAPESKAPQNQGHVYSLFVDPSFHGLGLGNEFLNFAKISYDALSLDVNEDNDKAREFYVKRGFSVVSRSEKDNQGRPFPLLRMVWKK